MSSKNLPGLRRNPDSPIEFRQYEPPASKAMRWVRIAIALNLLGLAWMGLVGPGLSLFLRGLKIPAGLGAGLEGIVGLCFFGIPLALLAQGEPLPFASSEDSAEVRLSVEAAGLRIFQKLPPSALESSAFPPNRWRDTLYRWGDMGRVELGSHGALRITLEQGACFDFWIHPKDKARASLTATWMQSWIDAAAEAREALPAAGSEGKKKGLAAEIDAGGRDERISFTELNLLLEEADS